jgi:ABC-type multidrug transport system fused ATPase/permease subunit
VRQADRILVLDRGEIVEQGTHDALLAIPNGHYHRLWALQQGPSMRPVTSENEVTR